MSRIAIADGWQLARLPAGACTEPGALEGVAPAWQAARVPGTAASAGADGGGDYDAHDWWYRVRFAAPARRGARQWLCFSGLATLAQAWLNGEPILASRNMFRARRVEVTGRLADVNQLVIRFAALRAGDVPRRPRARWKTALAPNHLRWFRTTLLGRMPGWTPPVAPVGPWRPVELECAVAPIVESLELVPRVAAGRASLRVRGTILAPGDAPFDALRLRLGNRVVHEQALTAGTCASIDTEVDAGDVPRWWPHTHGDPTLVAWRLEARRGGAWLAVRDGRVGFRELSLDAANGRVAFRVNGVPVFCRGWCWSPLDAVSLQAPPDALRAALGQVRDAGANMIRVGGTMAYESDAFYALCDALGILVWQDFMFANMDFPFADGAFRAEAEAEAREVVSRLAGHACIAAWCGGSEVAQQAAMMGLPAAHWTNEFFSGFLPRLVAGEHGAPYVPSTPWGGALPFHVGTGIAHYYGVGAYRRPLADVKAAGVRFAAECLAFANPPEPEALARAFGDAAPPPHHPRWKAGVPRDNGAGWDFEDVRDHYLAGFFGIDAPTLRARDLPRYHALSRAVPGELARRVFASWRAKDSGCGGAFVWLLRDLAPGAGWGSIDVEGGPKAIWWQLRRAWAPRAIHITDEGLDGLVLHVVNDAPRPLEARVELELLREGRVPIAQGSAAVRVEPHASVALAGDALLGRFTDATHAYRFGPPAHDACVARLCGADGTVLSEDFLFPGGMPLARPLAAGLEARAVPSAPGTAVLTLRSEVLLLDVRIAGPWLADDNHFHLAPGREKRVRLRFAGGVPEDIRIEALNLAAPVAPRAPAPSGANARNAGGSNLQGGPAAPQPEVKT